MLGIVAARTHRDEHTGTIFGEDDVPSPMAAPRQSGDDRLGGTGGLQIAGSIGKADDRVGIRDIDKSRVRSGRPERDAKRPIETVGEGVDLWRSRVARRAQHANAAGSALRDKNVASRCNPEQTRVIEPAGEELNGKARRRLRPRAARASHDAGVAVSARRRVRRWHVRRGNLASYPRRIAAPITIGCGAGQDWGGLT